MRVSPRSTVRPPRRAQPTNAPPVLFTVAVQNLVFLNYFYFFYTWALVGVIGLSTIYLTLRPVDKSKADEIE